nr:KinB-signaling pathway activation protein [Piscibacillus salipiscarius]
MLFVLFDLVYFRYTRAEDPGSLFPYIVVPAMLLIYSYAVAKVKAKETHPRAFLPALFFMIVVTTVEWIPALRIDEREWIMLMIVPLLAVNTYQLLTLHKIVGFNEGPSEHQSKQIKKGSFCCPLIDWIEFNFAGDNNSVTVTNLKSSPFLP